MAHVCGIIPAAGRSRRMGTAKQLLDVDGLPMLGRVAMTLARTSVEAVVVVTRHEIADRLGNLHAKVRFAYNESPELEMIDSIRIGLTCAPESFDGYLVCPGDLPRITGEDFELCLKAFRQDPQRIIVGTYRERRGHPIIIPSGLLKTVLSPACDGGLHNLVHSSEFAEIQEVVCASRGIHHDVNTPDDYRRI